MCLRSVPHSRPCHLWVCPSSCYCSCHHHVRNEEAGGTISSCCCPLWSLSHATPEAYLLHLWESFSKVARTWFKKIQIKKKKILSSSPKTKLETKTKDKMNLIQTPYSGTLWLMFCHWENLALITRFMTWWLQLVTGHFWFKSIKTGSHSPNIKFFKKVCNAEWKQIKCDCLLLAGVSSLILSILIAT